ncbi:hypothetical protein B0H11DRAFT_1926048 [Mycena galericulata]|nr:hypothetical protein B0H11DRAFT_1926048 [Mycena galericulata]
MTCAGVSGAQVNMSPTQVNMLCHLRKSLCAEFNTSRTLQALNQTIYDPLLCPSTFKCIESSSEAPGEPIFFDVLPETVDYPADVAPAYQSPPAAMPRVEMRRIQQRSNQQNEKEGIKLRGRLQPGKASRGNSKNLKRRAPKPRTEGSRRSKRLADSSLNIHHTERRRRRNVMPSIIAAGVGEDRHIVVHAVDDIRRIYGSLELSRRMGGGKHKHRSAPAQVTASQPTQIQTPLTAQVNLPGFLGETHRKTHSD